MKLLSLQPKLKKKYQNKMNFWKSSQEKTSKLKKNDLNKKKQMMRMYKSLNPMNGILIR
jgi:hypothetical protein